MSSCKMLSQLGSCIPVYKMGLEILFFFWLLWILIVVLGLSLVGACRLLFLRSTGSRAQRVSSCGMWA